MDSRGTVLLTPRAGVKAVKVVASKEGDTLTVAQLDLLRQFVGRGVKNLQTTGEYSVIYTYNRNGSSSISLKSGGRPIRATHPWLSCLRDIPNIRTTVPLQVEFLIDSEM